MMFAIFTAPTFFSQRFFDLNIVDFFHTAVFDIVTDLSSSANCQNSTKPQDLTTFEKHSTTISIDDYIYLVSKC